MLVRYFSYATFNLARRNRQNQEIGKSLKTKNGLETSQINKREFYE
jgi:hypothetical protein